MTKLDLKEMMYRYHFCFRDNSHGQIGSECAEAVVAKPVESLSHVVSIACGSHHSLAIQLIQGKVTNFVPLAVVVCKNFSSSTLSLCAV